MTGSELRKMLDDKGIKYTWLADQLHVTLTSVSKWMEDKMPISDEREAEIVTVINNRSLNPI